MDDGRDDVDVPLGTREGYDRWSSVYDKDGNPLCAVEQPVFDRLTGDPAGLSVIDVGCGTGRHALRLADRGADVTGVDFSSGMLERARAKESSFRVRFVRHDITMGMPFGDASFDLVVCALVLDHVRELGSFFRELRRVCRPRGRIVMTVMHPAMMLKGVQARFIDPLTGRRIRVESSRNTISDYVRAALVSGMTIESIEEHAVSERIVAACPRGAPYLGWPILFAMSLRPVRKSGIH